MCSGGAPLVHCFGSFALCVPMAWSPFASPVRSRYELCSQVILFLSCVWLLITCGACVFLVVAFSFIFQIVTVCVVNALIKGEIEDQECPRTSVVAP